VSKVFVRVLIGPFEYSTKLFIGMPELFETQIFRFVGKFPTTVTTLYVYTSAGLPLSDSSPSNFTSEIDFKASSVQELRMVGVGAVSPGIFFQESPDLVYASLPTMIISVSAPALSRYTT